MLHRHHFHARQCPHTVPTKSTGLVHNRNPLRLCVRVCRAFFRCHHTIHVWTMPSYLVRLAPEDLLKPSSMSTLPRRCFCRFCLQANIDGCTVSPARSPAIPWAPETFRAGWEVLVRNLNVPVFLPTPQGPQGSTWPAALLFTQRCAARGSRFFVGSQEQSRIGSHSRPARRPKLADTAAEYGCPSMLDS